MTLQPLKKALFIRAFFISVCSLLTLVSHNSASANSSCPPFVSQDTATISHVYDGDTVQLSDGRKVRFIGIDTPELAKQKGHKSSPSQPYAKAAKQFLQSLINQYGSRIQLMADEEPHDKYSRSLYHLRFVNGPSLQLLLLEKGYAVAFTTPPNQLFSQCYSAAEQKARKQQRGVWQHSRYQTKAVSQLARENIGFQLIRGSVSHIGESKKAYWLNFDKRFSVRIDKRDRHYFNMPLENYLNKTITVRGWLRHYKNKMQMSVRHPSAIELH